MKRNLYIISLALTSLVVAACQKSSTTAQISKYSMSPANLRLNLTDAPNDELTHVYVNIDHTEILISGGGKKARLILGQNLGLIDLMAFQNGILLPVQDVAIPSGVSAHQIRLVLKPDGHYATKSDGSTCAMQTPSEQMSGIKILVHQDVLFENNFSYSLVVDFDAQKSVVQKGNGECLLKPVLKLKSATRLENGGREGVDDQDVVNVNDPNPVNPDVDESVNWGDPVTGDQLTDIF